MATALAGERNRSRRSAECWTDVLPKENRPSPDQSHKTAERPSNDPRAVEWGGEGESGVLHRRQRAGARQHRVVEALATGLVVSLEADVHRDQDPVARVEPDVDVARHEQAAHEQRGGDQENDGHCHLADDERAAETRWPPAFAPRTWRAKHARERRNDVDAPRARGGHEPEEDDRRQRDGRGVQRYPRVDGLSVRIKGGQSGLLRWPRLTGCEIGVTRFIRRSAMLKTPALNLS